MNLTRASLDAASKYPWAKRSGSNKFGVYEEDLDIFNWVRQGRVGDEVSFEAQVMDWSDDVAYCVHDVEDAIHEGHVDVGILNSDSGRSEVVEIAREWYGPQLEPNALDEALVRLRSLVTWPTSYDGTLKSQAALKNLTSHLIGRFCLSVQRATQEKFGHTSLIRYGANLVVPEESRYEVTALKALAARFVMTRAGADVVYERQRQFFADLYPVISAAPESHLDSIHLALWKVAPDERAQKRAIIDQLASLTDVSLTQWHSNLCN